MKKSPKIVTVDQVEEKTPPNGGGSWRRLITSADTEAGLLFGYGVIKPGEGRGWHIHPPGEDEVFFVISGVGLAQWRSEGKNHEQQISSGTAFYTPGDMENNITNVGDSDLLCVFCIYKPEQNPPTEQGAGGVTQK